MGLYSVLLGVGQLIGGGIGGPFAQLWGVDGVIYLTLILGFVAMFTILRLYHSENRVDASMPYLDLEVTS